MILARSGGKALKDHVTPELECFDRLHFNACAPLLQGPRTHVADRLEFLPGPVAGFDKRVEVCHVDCPAPRSCDKDRALQSCPIVFLKAKVQASVPS